MKNDQPAAPRRTSQVTQTCKIETISETLRDESFVASYERRQVAIREAERIARSELARRRRKLGTLTREQEAGLEILLLTTVTLVSNLTTTLLERSRLYS
jgi:hypothetical protein